MFQGKIEEKVLTASMSKVAWGLHLNRKCMLLFIHRTCFSWSEWESGKNGRTGERESKNVQDRSVMWPYLISCATLHHILSRRLETFTDIFNWNALQSTSTSFIQNYKIMHLVRIFALRNLAALKCVAECDRKIQLCSFFLYCSRATTISWLTD